ncbi:MAG: type I methionyl aminopeptidase [Planctomycetaceae bacterium]|nr:type I methionyl aminopeptidase [Planctomycetaceae bacterium]
MFSLKSAVEIEKMRRAGICVWYALEIVRKVIRPGITTGEIDARVERFYNDNHLIPLFKGYPGKVPFPAVTCISVNEEVVHGIPGKRVLVEGDIVGVDTGAKANGWCGDSAFTFSVGKISSEKQRLLDVTQGVLQLAIDEIPKAAYWSEVARRMENYVLRNGFSVVEQMVGHGIGRKMHEEPQVPNYLCKELLHNGDFRLSPGTVIAVEPMVNTGTKKVAVLKDQWTIVTADRLPSAHFEHTLAVTGRGVKILTGPPQTGDEMIDITPYIGD